MSAIVFMFVCSVSVFIITVLYVYCYYVCYLHVLVNTFPFIQRTEQVLIELDISAIEEYVIIIIIAFL